MIEWFWRGAALRDARGAGPQAGNATTSFAQRATTAADFARVAWTSASFEPCGNAIACDLYRQSTYWALSSLAQDVDHPSETNPTQDIWSTLSEQLVAEAVGPAASPDALRTSLRAGAFVYFAELSTAEQSARCFELSALVTLLLADLNRREAELNKPVRQRIWRMSLALSLLAVVGLGAFFFKGSWENTHDLAAGRPWKTSSSYGGGGCTTPEQECAGASGWFFHTRESDASPWIEFALDGERSVSKVLVKNREDCCQERAVPLVIEVSEDHKHWKRVAQRDEEFSVWRASFPTVHARWLRLRVRRKSALHLAHVRIFP